MSRSHHSQNGHLLPDASWGRMRVPGSLRAHQRANCHHASTWRETTVHIRQMIMWLRCLASHSQKWRVTMRRQQLSFPPQAHPTIDCLEPYRLMPTWFCAGALSKQSPVTPGPGEFYGFLKTKLKMEPKELRRARIKSTQLNGRGMWRGSL